VTLRGELKEARDQLKREAAVVRAVFNAARDRRDLERVADQVGRLRDRYLQTELLVDFYVDAVRSRGNPEVGAQLRACDVMAERAILIALEPLKISTPAILTYFKPGIGASILRIGTRLWDGSLSRIAAIKITWHNRFRTTALVHECGHQVAGLTGWNEAGCRGRRGGGRRGSAARASRDGGRWHIAAQRSARSADPAPKTGARRPGPAASEPARPAGPTRNHG
jgi:hypothetical protein